MKKYLVIGNPVEHSLSPKLHNYWIKKNNLNAIYEKKKVGVARLKPTRYDKSKGTRIGPSLFFTSLLHTKYINLT